MSSSLDATAWTIGRITHDSKLYKACTMSGGEATDIERTFRVFNPRPRKGVAADLYVWFMNRVDWSAVSRALL